MKIPKLSISTHGDGNVLVKISPPEKENRGNVDIVCVIDVSGSMQIEATMKDEKGDVETHGLSILDVVKHSVKTIINTMKDNDRLSIVTFSTEAKVIFDLIPMTEEGRKEALGELEKLDVETQTNLWDGLLKGMEVVRKAEKMPSQSHVILFTDGLPNVDPPRSHLEMLSQYRNQYAQLRPTLHFFGFGYSLDSKLLEDLARSGCGMYSYIPDSSFVGTIFVNALANIFTTMTTNSILELEPLNGAKITQVVGGEVVVLLVDDDEKKSRLYPGTLRYGSSKDIVLKMTYPETKDLPYLNVKLRYPTPYRVQKDGEEEEEEEEEEEKKKDSEITETSLESGEWDEKCKKEIDIQYIRCTSVDAMRKSIDHCYEVVTNKDDNTSEEDKEREIKGAQRFIDEQLTFISTTAVKGNEYVKDLVKDLSGQVTLACSRKEWFERWGNHYLRSILCAHADQYCNNFKDPGVQHHGKSRSFLKYQSEGEEVFSSMPPPKAMPQKNPFEGTEMAHLWQPESQQQQPARNFSMREYYDYDRVCVSGDCFVRVAGGFRKRVKDLKKGDTIFGGAKVKCVLKTVIVGGQTRMCGISDSGLLITPYHPIRIASSGGCGCWVFPNQIAEEKIVACDAVYNFVLEGEGGVMVVNGIEVATLGHGMTDNHVVRHEYFGTQNVVSDLEKFQGWKDGMIVIRHEAIRRDKISNLIVGLDKSFEVLE